jgi:hypothetical protein
MVPYGSLPESERFLAGDLQGKPIILTLRMHRKRWILGTLAATTVLAFVAVSLLQNQGVILCDASTCMFNTPANPPGVVGEPPAPRILSPNELTKLKKALEEEEFLEAEVGSV